MGNLSKEANLKFTKENFRELDALDLLINLWTYNHFEKHKPCLACDTYSRYCKEVLKEIWCEDRGNFDFVVERLKKFDETFININNYSECTKSGILDKLIEINKKRINCKTY